MLDFGFSEILLTSAIALVVLGPERLPKVARQVGNWMGRARLMARQLSEQLEREVNAEELSRQQTAPARKPDQPAPSPLEPAAHVPLADAPPPLAQGPAIAAAPPHTDAYHDAQATTAAAMHPVTPAPTTVDPSNPANE
jgi:sec-independent protein translocase protein TatB